VEKEAGGHVYNEVTDPEVRYRQRYVDLALHPDVRDVFRERARMVTEIRRFLDQRGYVEVETPVLQALYGGATARPFTTHHHALDQPLFLRIADELYLKRLLVGGFEGVYEIAKDFRNEGLSRYHNPEFTMLELYVAFRDYRWMMELVEGMLETVAVALHGIPESVAVGADGERRRISFRAPFPRRPFFDLIEETTGRDFRGLDREAAANAADALGVAVAPEMGLGKIVDEVFGAFVEPGLIQPTFVVDYPVALSPLAKRHREDPQLVERFELICNGKEICNAFSELNDPLDQRARFEEQGRLAEAGDDELPREMDEDYLRALEYGMPPAAGLGVGIDRLAMVMTGQASIRDVILFPLLRPEAPPAAPMRPEIEVHMGISARPPQALPEVERPAPAAPAEDPGPPPGGATFQFGVRARPAVPPEDEEHGGEG
jgi:lysyl-tRNA synthetase class 2